LTTPAGLPGGLTTPAGLPGGLTTPAGLPGGLTSPTGLPGEVPISAPIGLDPSSGTYPLLGDPSLGASPLGAGGGGGGGSGGLLGDLGSAAQTLGAGQAIDLLKGMVMPAIMGAIQSGAPAAAAPAAAAAVPAAAAAALPH
jgi:hypothetical protein